MFYPEKDKKYVRIRKNHRNYQEEMHNRRRIHVFLMVLLCLVLLGGGIYFQIPKHAINLAGICYTTMTGMVKKHGSPSPSKKTSGASNTEKKDRTSGNSSQKKKVKKDAVNESEDKTATLLFTGDVELSTYVQSNFDASGIAGVVSPQMQKVLRDADICAVNNEFAFSDRGTPADKQYTFRVAPSYVTIYEQLGIDVAGLANNHSLDYGQDALLDTIRVLSDAGIDNTGAGNSMDEAAKLIVKEVAGKRFGFLACSRVIPYANWDVRNAQPGLFTCYDPAELIERTKAAKEQCDYLFVMIHWGVESTTRLEGYQSQIGHAVIDAGADAVIGSHPHVLQGIEYYSGKPIFYSLGNFIFNQSIDQTAVVLVTQKDNGINYTLMPAYASGATTHLALENEDQKAEAVLNVLRELSPNVAIGEDGLMTER